MSRNFHAQALNATPTELGADRVLFSSDYPYESMREAADWFDNAPISENDPAEVRGLIDTCGCCHIVKLFVAIKSRGHLSLHLQVGVL